MKKSRTKRATVIILALILSTSCFVGGTFARYITKTSAGDNGRVALWGINADATTLDLFSSHYDGTVNAKNGDKLIAPGTSKTSNFSIINTSSFAPEVKYEITVDLTGSEIADSIKNNPNITWKLDDGPAGTWNQLLTSILKLSGDDTVSYTPITCESASKIHNAGAFPTELASGKTHTISWDWAIGLDEAANIADTAMGNAAVDGDLTVKLVANITASQID